MRGARRGQDGVLPLQDVVTLIRDVPARDGITEVERKGFLRLPDGEIHSLIAGKTLKSVRSFSYYGPGNEIKLMDMIAGKVLRSTGTWSVRDSRLCHSVHKKHEFCVGLFFRGYESLCWPGMGGPLDATGYLRPCAIVAGDLTK